MTLIRPVQIKCTACLHEWETYEGMSTNTFGMNEEEARAHLESFWKEYGDPKKKPCPMCGSQSDKEIIG